MENRMDTEMETAIWDYRVDVGVILRIPFLGFSDQDLGF